MPCFKSESPDVNIFLLRVVCSKERANLSLALSRDGSR